MIEAYSTFLEERNYSVHTVAGYRADAQKLLDWLSDQGLTVQQVTYQDMLAWVRQLQERQLSPKTINSYLRAARYLFDYLIESGQLSDNPAEEIKIKGQVRKVPHHLLKESELVALYQNYQAVGLSGKRNKVMLGFLIYQGLTTGALAKLQVSDVDLRAGKVFIPQVGRSNERKLALQANQIIDLQAYIGQIRSQILLASGKESEQLFITRGQSSKLGNAVSYLIKQLQRQNPKVRDAKQLRASVLTSWLGQYPIRKVQQLAGHRYVSSTEQYQSHQLKSLQEQIEKLHPLS